MLDETNAMARAKICNHAHDAADKRYGHATPTTS
jgi:hypothetical protein